MIRTIIFFLFTILISSCLSHPVNSDGFYEGLQVDDDDEKKISLFENSLESPNIYIRQAAAEQLAIMMLQGEELSGNTIQKIRLEVSGWWADAFALTVPAAGSRYLNKEKILSFLLGFGQNTTESFDQARLYVLNECKRQGLQFSEIEMAAIEGHNAVSKLQYNEALSFFRTFRENGVWPQQMPALFFEYPNLINDLGRAFQYTASGSEGYNLFLRWEAGLSIQADDLRYRLVFFAGRIARRMGASVQEQAISLFERALTLAPDYEQQDASIWYILDMSLTGPIDIIMERLERLAPVWHSGSYFNAILERYLHRLISARDWRRILTTYSLIENSNSITKSGFAWAIARVIQEGYLSAEEMRIAAGLIKRETPDPSVFFRIAYDSGSPLIMPGLYYRMQSADALGLPFLIFSEDRVSCECNETPPSDALTFLLGFFENDAVSYSLPYIRSMEDILTPCELRSVAKALQDEHMHPQSMRLITLYIFREGYVRERRDLEIMYPRPYLELIETHARLFDIEPSIFFGLIRTESAFQSAVVSRAGAVGLSQLMPTTGREQAERIRRAGGPDFFSQDGTLDSTNPELNVYIGSFYLNHQRNTFNDMVLALMAYNAGHTRVRRWRAASNMPTDLFVETVTIYETRDYGRRVPAIGRIYEELYYR